MPDHDADARRALGRLQRSVEKTRRELDALREAVREGAPDEVPVQDYAEADAALDRVSELARTEGARLQERVLRGAGLDLSRLRRS